MIKDPEMEDYLGLFRWTLNVITSAFTRGRQRKIFLQKRKGQCDDVMKMGAVYVEDRRAHEPRNVGGYEKVKKTVSPQSLPAHALTLVQ